MLFTNEKIMNHFALNYAKRVNEILHDVLWSTWFYKFEIIEVPGLVTALLVTYDNQKDDQYLVSANMSREKFLKRMNWILKQPPYHKCIEGIYLNLWPKKLSIN